MQTIWKWFCDRKHNFTLQDHIYIFGLIKNVLAAQSKAELEHFYASFIQDDVVTNYPEVAQYFSMYYGRREEWALYYRKNLFQCEVTELYECAMEVMKDFILQRVKKFNIIQVRRFQMIPQRVKRIFCSWLILSSIDSIYISNRSC